VFTSGSLNSHGIAFLHLSADTRHGSGKDPKMTAQQRLFLALGEHYCLHSLQSSSLGQ
jgi:hypothetical protein